MYKKPSTIGKVVEYLKIRKRDTNSGWLEIATKSGGVGIILDEGGTSTGCSRDAEVWKIKMLMGGNCI